MWILCVSRTLHLLFFACDLVVVSAITAYSIVAEQPVASFSSTCQLMSINYITHNLPQQCLKSRPTSSQDRALESPDKISNVDPSISFLHSGATERAVQKDVLPLRELPETTSFAASSSIVKLTVPSQNSGYTQPFIHPVGESGKDGEIEESPLDSVKFLSFEEWKVQNLARAGQSTEAFEERAMREPRRAPASLSSALDSLGEESEINIDFDFSSGSGSDNEAVTESTAAGVHPSDTGMPRSKDAGKTCKERFNYASFDCAATVHKHNPDGKGANSILVENKETYMLNKCEATDKFLVVELCEDILVDTVVLANFEFFSSVFKDISVSVSDRYPVKSNGWMGLGIFQARNTRDVQAFMVPNPLIWARYLKIELLSQYGNEYYCPLSLLRVHGTTMMEEFRHQEVAREEVEDITGEMEIDTVTIKIEENIHSLAITEDSSSRPRGTFEPFESSSEDAGKLISQDAVDDQVSDDLAIKTSTTPNFSSSKSSIFTVNPILMCERGEKRTVALITPLRVSLQPEPTWTEQELPSQTPSLDSPESLVSIFGVGHSQLSAEALTLSEPMTAESSARASEAVRVSPPQSQPPSATPTTQESFFKSVHKRLTALESNSTLSLQYIEEQSRILRDAFSKAEKSQLSRNSRFLSKLNDTVVAELRSYRDQYDQLWQSTVIALESQREHSEREMVAISTRLTLLADEVIFQKRMYQLNTVLLLITIGVVIFSRNDRLAIPLVQHLRTRSGLRVYDSPPSSPPPLLLPSGSTYYRRRSSESAGSCVSPSLELSPMATDYSKYGSSSPRETKSSPSTPRGIRDARSRSWMNFGPNLRVENKGRRWQRLPSPLGNADEDDDYDIGNEESIEGETLELAGRRDSRHTDSSGEPGEAVYRGHSYLSEDIQRTYKDVKPEHNTGLR